MTLLAEVADTRQNNFNLLRLIAAMAVLVSHSWPLATGDNNLEPLKRWIGISLGGVAVQAFFILSGFLVTSSLLRRQDVTAFLFARITRIYPALIVVVLCSVALGLVLSTLPVREYLAHEATHLYLFKNMTMVTGFAVGLPGVFDHTPYGGSANGSLWTLPWELWMYCGLACIWLISGVAGTLRGRVCAVTVVVLASFGAASYVLTHCAPGWWPKALWTSHSFFPAFFLGAAFYVLRQWIPLELRYCVAAIGAVLAVGLTQTSHEATPALRIVLLLALPYIVLYLAYVRGPLLRRFDRVGDVSYGMYIWAFPIQQCLVLLLPNISPVEMIGLATPLTLMLAWSSWHFVEHPILAGRERVLTAARAYARRGRLSTAPQTE